MRELIISADDVGLHPGIDIGVAELVTQRVIASASVMALGQPDRDALRAMLQHGAGIGLHLDFTSRLAQERWGFCGNVAAMMAVAWTGRLDPSKTIGVIREQVQRFTELTGRMPDFIDGHQHVHQFPVIREALLQVWKEDPRLAPVFIRDTRSRRWRGAKAALIGALGAERFIRLARADGHRCNADFFGVYDLTAAADLPGLWRRWLAGLRANGALAMCHPSAKAAGIEPFRLNEFRFLRSEQFCELMAMHQVASVSWSRALGSRIRNTNQ